MTNNILTVIAFHLLWIYILLYARKSGLPYCLSETYYHTPKKFYFPVFMITQAALLYTPLLELVTDECQFITFILMSSILGLSVSPFRADTFKYKVHYICSLIAMFSVSALHVIEGTWYLIPLLLAFFILPILQKHLRHLWLLSVELSIFHLTYLFILIAPHLK